MTADDEARTEERIRSGLRGVADAQQSTDDWPGVLATDVDATLPAIGGAALNRRRRQLVLAAAAVLVVVVVGSVFASGGIDRPARVATGNIPASDRRDGTSEGGVTSSIINGSAVDLPVNGPYADGIRLALDLAELRLTRVTATGPAGEPVVNDQVNTPTRKGLSAELYHDCAAFLAEHQKTGQPTVASRYGKVWIGVVSKDLVSLSLYNGTTGAPLFLSYTSPDRNAISLDS